MKSTLQWIVANTPGFNVLMIMILLAGVLCALQLRRENFPEFELDLIAITVPYPGATPEEVEEGVCQKVEEAINQVTGIKKITSTASEGVGSISIELFSGTDRDRAMNEIKNRVDQISSFPELAERHAVQIVDWKVTIFRIGVLGPKYDASSSPHSSVEARIEHELTLRNLAERIRNELLDLPGIAQVDLTGSKQFQIDIEIPEETLRSYGTTLDRVAQTIRSENLQRPGGTLRASTQEVTLRCDNRRLDGRGIGELPVIATPEGAVLTVDDIGHVRDEFADSTASTLINGQPGVVLSIQRNTTEDQIKMVDEIRAYLETVEAENKLPPGYHTVTWGDTSIEVRARMSLLTRNGWQGLLIVFVCLALFLEMRLSFWIACGIPFSLCITMLYFNLAGETVNMMSAFALIMALGIVVDDAIVVGENVYSHRNMGKSLKQAAIDGTIEVMPSVFASIATTIIAFTPLLFVEGMMGKFVRVIPVALIAMLLASLIECMTILPCHLSHKDGIVFRGLDLVLYIFRPVLWLFKQLSRATSSLLQWAIDRIYEPVLRVVMRWRSVFLSICFTMLAVAVAAVMFGHVQFILFTKTDTNSIVAQVAFPSGTPPAVTERWLKHVEESFHKTIQKFDKQEGLDTENGETLVLQSFRVIGTQVSGRRSSSSSGSSGNQGSVQIELVDGSLRKTPSTDIINAWRKNSGIIPGAEDVSFGAISRGPGGSPIEFMLLAPKEMADELEEIVELSKAELAKTAGVMDISDNNTPGKWEFRLSVKPEAYAMGVKVADLANTIRAVYYGAEVQRLQRGRHEVKVMVCYPREDRHSLAKFNEIRVTTNDGVQRPISEIADIKVVRGYTKIDRIDQRRSITVRADVDETLANANLITQNMQAEFFPELFRKYPGLSVRWEGHVKSRSESFGSLKIGLGLAMFGMFTLLAFQFRSYFQPLVVLAIIPFGVIGAVIGHYFMSLPITLFSVFGMVGLSGIVVNDSIVLVDFINARFRAGMPLHDAIIEAGRRRLRPVLLTSMTTVGGLLPILTEDSLQARLIIPMATSIAFGVMFSTMLILLMVPVLYSIYADAIRLFGHPATMPSDESNDLSQPLDSTTLEPGNSQPLQGPHVNAPHSTTQASESPLDEAS